MGGGGTSRSPASARLLRTRVAGRTWYAAMFVFGLGGCGGSQPGNLDAATDSGETSDAGSAHLDAGVDAAVDSGTDAAPLHCVDQPVGTWSHDFALGGVTNRARDAAWRTPAVVMSVALSTDGRRAWVGGSFTHAGLSAASNVATYSDDTGWEPLGEGIDRPVIAVAAASDGTVYAAPRLAGADTSGTIFRWDGVSWSALATFLRWGWGVETLVVGPDDRLYVAGSFRDLGGRGGPSSFAVWDGTAWTDDGVVTDGAVHAVLADAEGLCIGGDFGWVSGVLARYVACRDASGWSARDLAAMPVDPFDAVVRTLARTADGTLVAGGRFSLDGAPTSTSGSFVQWDGSQFVLAGGGVADFTSSRLGVVQATAVTSLGVWLGGNFSRRLRPLALNLSAWTGRFWVGGDLGLQGFTAGSYMNAYVQTLAGRPDAPTLWAGGFLEEAISGVDLIAVGGVARFDGTRWSSLSDLGARALGLGGFTTVNDVAPAGGCDLWLTGPSSSGTGWLGGVARLSFADGYTSFGGTFGGSPSTVAAAPDGTLYVGGAFFDAASFPHAFQSIARWNGTGWEGVGDASDWIDGSVNAIAFDRDGNLIAGGQWRDVGVPERSSVAMWDGASWSALGSGIDVPTGRPTVTAVLPDPSGGVVVGMTVWDGCGPGCYEGRVFRFDGRSWTEVGDPWRGMVNALTWWHGDLVAGGTLLPGDLTTHEFVARWDGASWAFLGDAAVGPPLATRGDELYATELTPLADGSIVTAVVQWQGSTSSWERETDGVDGRIYAMTIVGDALVLVGDFHLAGDVVSSEIAVWRLPE